jgi:hypothetical protein
MKEKEAKITLILHSNFHYLQRNIKNEELMIFKFYCRE